MRPHCPICLRPLTSCICRWVTPVEHTVDVLILQHPQEVAQAKGSARLLHLCLPHSRMVVGEVFDETALRALLDGPRQSVLLYPDTPQGSALGLPPPPPLAPGDLSDPARLRLVVLDGTWRKSRKMLYCNPLLQRLPRLPLQGLPVSRYRIRKAHRADQLSTLEATCAALTHLERDPERFAPLLAAFDGFVAQQLELRTRDHAEPVPRTPRIPA